MAKSLRLLMLRYRVLQNRKASPMPRTTLLTVIAIVLAVLAATRPTAAQGTFGALPDPISSHDLERWAARLSLSDQQLLAIAEPHGRYLAEFTELRDRDMQQFLDDVQTLARDFDFSQRRQVEQQVRALNRIMLRVRSLDENLFNEMLEVLTDDQAAMLPRVRLERERARYSGEMTRGIDFLNPAVRVDLSAMIRGMNLSPQVMETVDPILESYERRLTMAARGLFETTTNMILDTLKRLEEMGFTEGSPQDPRMALRLFEAFQEIWSEISSDLLKEATEVAALQRSTFRSLAGVLPEDAARQLRSQYFRRAYPEAAGVGRVAERQFNTALDLEDLTPRQREDIEALAASHRQAQDRIANQIADLLDARRRDFSIREIVRRNEDERSREIDELRARADAADEAIVKSLHDALGGELAQRVQAGRAAGGVGGGQASRRANAPANDVDSSDPFLGRLPGRISATDVGRYASVLQLDDGRTAVLESMHEDYLARYRDLSEQHLVPLRTAARDLAATSIGIGSASDQDRQRAEMVFALQRDAFTALRELDESFFDDIHAIIEASQADMLQRLRLRRERLAYTGGAHQPRTANWGEGARFARGQVNEGHIDLSLLVDELRLGETLSADADRSLMEYERQATELFRDKYNAELQMYQALRTVDFQGERRRFREIMGSAGRISTEMNRALATLNRASLAQLRAAMSDENAHYLQHYYRRHAFPEVFEDPGHAEETIAAAIDLSELSESQRTRLRELSLEYRGSYARIADEMFQLHEALAADNEDDRQRRMERRLETHNRLERLRFERNELNESARRQLRAILSEEQRRRIAEL